MFDIAPAVTQDTVINIASQVLQLLTLLGMIIDPTTAGINDSVQAMTYEVPRKSR
jgi:phi LC3 family holin